VTKDRTLLARALDEGERRNKLRQTLVAAGRLSERGPVCDIVWIEAPGRLRGLILPRKNGWTPSYPDIHPYPNHIGLIADMDTGEIEALTLTKWLADRGRTDGMRGHWRRGKTGPRTWTFFAEKK
jgi:hypothetical protein